MDERKEKELASKAYINWEQLLRDLGTVLGVDTWTRARREQVSETIGVSRTTLDRLVRDLSKLGFYNSRPVDGGRRKGSDGKDHPIRAQEWRLTADPDTILAEAKKRGFVFGTQSHAGRVQDFSPRHDKPRGYEPVRKVEPQPELPANADYPDYVDYYAKKEEHDIEPEPENTFTMLRRIAANAEIESPFAVLKPLRKDEAAALIEASRQYQDKMSFINEEIERFADHGITLDPSVIGFPRDHDMEVIGQVLSYVTTLEKQAERNMAQSSGSAEVGELKTQIKRQQATIEELIRERAERDRDATRIANHWSGKEKTLKDRIEDLEQQLHEAKRQPVAV